MVTIQPGAEPRTATRREPQIRSLTLSDQVARVLARRIVNGEIGGPEPPPTEQGICEEFGVSKTTAREVIRALSVRGLVEVRHGRRMRIRAASEWNHLDPLLLELRDDPGVIRRYLADLHDVRMLLEPEIAARAAIRADPGQLERLRASLVQMRRLEGDPDAYVEVDLVFHRDLAAAADNAVLAFVLDSVGELLRVSRRVTSMLGSLSEVTDAHARIVDAVAAREPEAARQAMRAHLLTVTGVWVLQDADAQVEAAFRRGDSNGN